MCIGVIVSQITGFSFWLAAELLPAPESLPGDVPLPWGVEEPCKGVSGTYSAVAVLAEGGTIRLDGN